MCLYYFIFLRLIRHRTLKFSPKIVTSQKSHGKWGDFIICFVPVAWCTNILSNSNFIMRMIEWQSESSLFTVRIRGRQWYWVYKIELKDLLKATNVTKNIGHNYWEMFNNANTDIIQDLNAIQIRNHNKEYLDIYKRNVNSIVGKTTTYSRTIGTNNISLKKKIKVHPSFLAETNQFPIERVNNPYLSESEKSMRCNFIAFINSDNSANIKHVLSRSDVTLNPNLTHNALNNNKRLTRIRSFAKLNYINLNQNSEFNWTNSGAQFIAKTTADNLYFVIKQKRFAAPIKKISTVDTKVMQPQLVLNNFSTLSLSDEFVYTRKWSAKRLKHKSGTIPLAYSKRLLRTRRVLVLPSQVNITLITNSFDVVHSWYIPGLGIKLDCIPGRSTHHTIFIDHAGFYYGQCAEICGRYHHHMPIRVCALPFEHFLIWWYHYGLPYFNATACERKTSIKSGLKQYSW